MLKYLHVPSAGQWKADWSVGFSGPDYAVSQSWQQKSLSLWCILGVGAWAGEAAGLAEAKIPVGAIFCQWVLCGLCRVSETLGSKITLDPRLLLISKITLDPRLFLIQDYSWSKITLDPRLLLIQDYSWSKTTLLLFGSCIPRRT